MKAGTHHSRIVEKCWKALQAGLDIAPWIRSAEVPAALDQHSPRC